VLSFFGGGKDSLVAARLLAQLPDGFDTLAYSSSIYGSPKRQHDLISALLAFCNPTNCRRQYVFEDFVDSPVLTLGDKIVARTLAAAETPASIFAALPYVLQHGYKYIVLAHERSADIGQTVWTRTGEEVNHQWGKSQTAEKLIHSYLSRRLIADLTYVSILKPVYDAVIFHSLNGCLNAVPHTHSCNIAKPWCGRCAKCVYVWLNYLAFLPPHIAHNLFGQNLFDAEWNEPLVRQMLGLEGHLPFECIGQHDEVKLAFELCRRKDMKGRLMDIFVRETPPPDYTRITGHYSGTYFEGSLLLDLFEGRIAAELRNASRATRSYLQSAFT
jgi:hypothetical protein